MSSPDPVPAPRRICFVCEATQGGVRKHLRDLFSHLTRPGSGCVVRALLGDRGEPGLGEELEQFKATGAFDCVVVPQFQREIRPWRDIPAYMALKEHLAAWAPDVVHTHSAKAGFLGRAAAHSLGVKTILHTPHVFPFQWAHGPMRRVYTALERHAAAQCHRLICVGEGQREDALHYRICAPEKLAVIRNGVLLPPPFSDAERAWARAELGAQGEDRVIGMVARLAPQKGLGFFVDAAAQVLQRNARARFVVLGGPLGGPEEAALRARMQQCGVPPGRFTLLGHRNDIERLYAGFDIAALSSLYEGLPYVLLEAMARKIPVVATDVLGSRDVVAHGVTGYLAPVNNTGMIVERLLELLGDELLRFRMGEAAQDRVRVRFALDDCLRGHDRLYGLE